MIYNRIKEYRTLNGISQEELAVNIGVSRNAIVGYENYLYKCSLYVVFRLLDFFHCKFDDMFYEIK